MFSEGRQVSATPNSEMLGVVEDMSHRLLTEEEVAAVMKTCRRVRHFVHSCRQSETLFVDVVILTFGLSHVRSPCLCLHYLSHNLFTAYSTYQF